MTWAKAVESDVEVKGFFHSFIFLQNLNSSQSDRHNLPNEFIADNLKNSFKATTSAKIFLCYY